MPYLIVRPTLRTWVLLAAFALLFLTAVVNAWDVPRPTIALTLNPTGCVAPCAVRFRITITDYEKTRAVCITLTEEGFDGPDRTSCWPWDGRKFTDGRFSNIGQGTWTFRASLGETGPPSDSQILTVVGEQQQRSPEL